MVALFKIALAGSVLAQAHALISIQLHAARPPVRSRGILLWSSSDAEDKPFDDGDAQPMPIIDTSTVRFDDGGSDLTDRFKYKVNALMGAFDPADATVDNEHHNGNILNAMLKFPVVYTFNVVGKTEGEERQRERFVSQVRAAVLQETGELEDQVSSRITPRGAKFTKVAITTEVQSAEMISNVYDALKGVEMSVMQF